MINRLILRLRDLLQQNQFRIRGENNQLLIAEDVRQDMSKIRIKINGKNNRLVIGSGTKITNTEIRMDGTDNLIEIGKNCKYRSGKIYLRNGHNKHIKIGDETTVENAYLLTDEQANIDIGRDCMLSAEIMMRTGDKHSVLDLKSKKRVNHAQDISVSDHVWVGRDVLILKGSQLPRDSIVGARSTVTHAFQETNIAIAGIPAKVIKKDIYWEKELL